MSIMFGGAVLAILLLVAMSLGVVWIRKKEDQSQSRAQQTPPADPITKRLDQYNKHSTELLLIHRFRLAEKADALRAKKLKHFAADPELTAKLGLYDKLDKREQAIRIEITILDEILRQRGLEAGKHYYR
ncbi:hypothetical protein [Pseudomonas oryzihabitans]|uniref:hypothetical protein n=1 Tax=Pseudomonas oryzihabitans TaxID=47885 RepID=UPI002B1E8756|nr:hypothetical protein [Pseudomonas oryzihabitans]